MSEPVTTPFNIPKEAERIAEALRSDGLNGGSWEGSVALALDVLRTAFEVGYKRGLKEAGSDLV